MKVVVAADKFRGTLTAVQACTAMASGVAGARPDALIEVMPLADGGEGTMDVLVDATSGARVDLRVAGPLGDPIDAPLGLLADGAVIEMALCSGLRVAPRLAPLEASSHGVGDAIAQVATRDVGTVMVCIGGSASTDGGTGAARALGWRFLDASGRELPEGGGSLHLLRAIAPGREVSLPSIVGLCDVNVGLEGSAALFAPQKGATPSEVIVLEEGLARLDEVIRSDLSVDVARLPGAGAGGGMGAGLAAFFGATLRSGAEEIASYIGLDGVVGGADLVVTGEGSFDEGSLAGKAPVVVARLAGEKNVPCALVAGRLGIEPSRAARAGFDRVVSVSEVVGERMAMTEAAAAVTEATRYLLASL